MGQVKEMVRMINKGKKLEETIPNYTNLLFDVYNQVSLLYITMDYYMLYELLQETKGRENCYLSDAIQVINQVVGETFASDTFSEETRESLLAQVLDTRNEVIKKMKILTMYTDKLQIYEHVLNRIELRFEDQIELADVDTFVQKVYHYIFCDDDQVMINEAIKEVLAELPVRMARSKYFELIENSMSVYKDSDRSAVDRFVYMLETSAMLYEPEGVEEYFLDIKAFSDRLSKVTFADLTESEFQELYEELQVNASYIANVADLYVSIQGILNSLYAYLASWNGVESTDPCDVACYQITKRIYELFENGKWENIPDEVAEKLVVTEGKQESLSDDLMQLEGVLMDVKMGQKELLERMNLVESFEKLSSIQQLLDISGMFVEFDQTQEEEVADQAYIQEQTEKLLSRLKEQFAQNEMCVVRAVIAATISKFPVFFTSSQEVEDYIRQSLERCQDDAERQASMNVIQSFMEGFEE